MVQRNKVKSFIKLVTGSSIAFVGYNLYDGNDKFYETVYRNLLPVAHRFVSPEFAHFTAIKCAKFNIGTNFKSSEIVYPNLQTNLWNLKFDNPIGLAAGFDKHGEAIYGLSNIGFGFVEVGSITPKPQQGNDKPRLFRLIEDQSIINRYGFNSVGHKTAKYNISKQKFSTASDYPIGINLGKNKSTLNSIDDYFQGLNEFKNLASYFVINISSPNTPGLRDLQNEKELDELLKQLQNYKKTNRELQSTPLFIKIAPDLNETQEKTIARLATKHRIDGLIISNTTIDRENLKDQTFKHQDGGLSGKALEKRSTELIKNMYKLTKGNIPIIGVGGVFNGQDAYNKILAGASLVQIYTALVYEGPLVVNKIKKELSDLLETNGYQNVKDAVGKGS